MSTHFRNVILDLTMQKQWKKNRESNLYLHTNSERKKNQRCHVLNFGPSELSRTDITNDWTKAIFVFADPLLLVSFVNWAKNKNWRKQQQKQSGDSLSFATHSLRLTWLKKYQINLEFCWSCHCRWWHHRRRHRRRCCHRSPKPPLFVSNSTIFEHRLRE